MTLSSRAYIQRMAEKYLPKPLETYAMCATPCDKTIVEHYEAALEARKESVTAVGKEFREQYARPHTVRHLAFRLCFSI